MCKISRQKLEKEGSPQFCSWGCLVAADLPGNCITELTCIVVTVGICDVM